jgi:branched-chain amino acid transport system permease protein
MSEANRRVATLQSGTRWRGLGWWAAYALLLLSAPLLFDSGLSQTLLAQMGIAIIACLSYNLLLGQGGMLSFGHAVYSGTGAFLAIHTLNRIHAGLWLPVSLVPLVAGLGSAALALALGWVCTRRPGTALAMITFGLGELVWATALMFPAIFGGEAGISANRVVGSAPWGISLGPPNQLLLLIAVYTWVCTALLFALTQTPFGRLLNAVRDNPQRLAFVGFDPHRVRWLAFVSAGFFAGVAGGLAALNFELVTAEVFSAQRSGAYLLFTVLGGSGYFVGPIIGAVGMVLSFVWLSSWTQAWLLYVGLAFVGVVMLAPGGVSALALSAWHAIRAGAWRTQWRRWTRRVAGAVLALSGFVMLVEMLYQLQQRDMLGTVLHWGWVTLQLNQPLHWCAAAAPMLLGMALLTTGRQTLHLAGPTQPMALRVDHPLSDHAATVVPVVLADTARPGVADGSGEARPLLRLQGLGKRFGSTQVLRDISLSVRAGECIGIIGPNGAGKSTLFDLISGCQRASTGQVWLRGRSLAGLTPFEIRRLGLSRSFQTSALFGRLTVQDNLRCALLWPSGYRYSLWHRLDHLPDLQAQTRELLQLLQLEAQRDTLAEQLSYADQRALELGLALAGGAEVVLLDEPTAGMNRAQAEHFTRLIRRVAVANTLLIVEHDMSVLFGLADKIAVISAGELIAFDHPAAVRANARVQQAYLGQPGPAGHGVEHA